MREGGARLASASRTHACTPTRTVILDAHVDHILALAHAPDVQQIASASADQGVKLWDATVDTEPTPLDVLRSREQRQQQA